ncbi:hypothetical protein N9W89_10685 [Hellea sp.]|nr:hypothetical protein [Hellea sp.]
MTALAERKDKNRSDVAKADEEFGITAAWDAVDDAMTDRYVETVKRGPCPSFKMLGGEFVPDLKTPEGMPDLQPSAHTNSMSRVYGVDRSAAISHIVQSQTAATGGKADDPRLLELNGTMAIVESLKANDALEGLLISQMTASYSTAMEFTGRARRATQIEFIDLYSKQSIKLMQLFNQQFLALNKYRKGNKQTVVVKHVHIHDGGQAVIDSSVRMPCASEHDRGGVVSEPSNNPMQTNSTGLCGAKTRSGRSCLNGQMSNGRCRMHGGLSTGAPVGYQNALKHGRYSAKAKREKLRVQRLVAAWNELYHLIK